MKKLLLSFSIFLFITPFFVQAENNSQNTMQASSTPSIYAICKKNALMKREKTMTPARKTYVASTTAIKNQALREFDLIRWYNRGSYRTNYKKIQENYERAMIPVNENIEQVRKLAQTTWKAEDALCDFMQAKASTTPKIVKKSTEK